MDREVMYKMRHHAATNARIIPPKLAHCHLRLLEKR